MGVLVYVLCVARAPLYTNTFLLITLVPQPLLLSVCLFLLIDSLFYLCVFTPILFVELVTLLALLLSIHIWISDIVRTFISSLVTLYPFLFGAGLLFVGSEALLFIACLWVMFSYLWVCSIDSILLPDPVELTFSNTLLLSIAATCLCVYSLTASMFMLNIYLYCAYLLGLLFLFMQVCEYQLLCFYISDSFFASSFYLITGLHFSHVIVGIVLLGFVFTSLYNVKLFYLNIQLFYWHFVEVIWLVLYIVFYSSKK